MHEVVKMYDFLISPFIDDYFLRKALIASIALSIGFAPLGIILVLRRMSLIGDSMAHAVFPGTAIGYVFAGGSLAAMTVGGIVAGILVVILSTFVTRSTKQKEDASFASFYILSLAAGFLLISIKGGDEEILHMLFGEILSIKNENLILIISVVTTSLLLLSIVYRPLIIGFLDPVFSKTAGGKGGLYHYLFFIIVVFNLVAGYRVLGALMVVGLMILPVNAARFWSERIERILIITSVIAAISSYAGLVISYQYKFSASASIILVCGIFYLFSILFGSKNSIYRKYFSSPHLQG